MKHLLGFATCVLLNSCQKPKESKPATASLFVEKFTPAADFDVWKIRVEAPVRRSRGTLLVEWGLNGEFHWKQEVIGPIYEGHVIIDTYVPYSSNDRIDYITVK